MSTEGSLEKAYSDVQQALDALRDGLGHSARTALAQFAIQAAQRGVAALFDRVADSQQQPGWDRQVLEERINGLADENGRLCERICALNADIDGSTKAAEKRRDELYDRLRRLCPTTDLVADEQEAARAWRKIEAIKLYRERLGVGLKDAKDAVERWMAAAGVAAREPHSDIPF